MTTTDAERAYLAIKEKIVKTELDPGSVINEAELMKDLKFGRTPIREALKRLQVEDLVMVKPRRGIFVSELAITDLAQIFEVRVELEALAAKIAAERITAEQLAALKKLTEAYQETPPRKKEKLIELDGKFHALIREATHNRFLISNLEHYYNLSLRIWYLALPQAAAEDIDIKAHQEIFQAIANGDGYKASARIATHIKEFHKTIKEYL
jgi:DNA-binding GntR family transcriptional regulator